MNALEVEPETKFEAWKIKRADRFTWNKPVRGARKFIRYNLPRLIKSITRKSKSDKKHKRKGDKETRGGETVPRNETPICLECECLCWNGFWAQCINVLMPESTIDEALELAEFEEPISKEIGEIKQDERFGKSLENMLMTIPYIVWKRKNVVYYDQHPPKTWDECPFSAEHAQSSKKRRLVP